MFILNSSLCGKVLIFTYSYNRSDFIEIQYKTLKKFLVEEFDYIVFNDATDASLMDQITATCKRYDIQCVRIPQEIHDQPYLQRWPGEDYHAPSVRNVNVVQYSLNEVGFAHDDILILFDSDLFLVKPFSIRDYLDGFQIGGMRTSTGHVPYLWHGLSFLDFGKMPHKATLNFNCGRVENTPVDAGGHSYYYMRDNPEVKGRWVNHYHSGHFHCKLCQQARMLICNHNVDFLQEKGFEPHEISLLHELSNIEFFHDRTFLHYRGGTNWDYKSAEYHARKTAALQKFVQEIMWAYE